MIKAIDQLEKKLNQGKLDDQQSYIADIILSAWHCGYRKVHTTRKLTDDTITLLTDMGFGFESNAVAIGNMKYHRLSW